jgi:regulator of nucleoside diphosphate kinase
MFVDTDAPTKPPIFVAEEDYEQLSSFAAKSSEPGAALLREELARATLVSDAASAMFVRLNARVEFADLKSGRVRTVTLVDPAHADMDQARLSVLTPVGAALLGLRPGDTFRWAVGGRPRALTVNRVVAPDTPAAAA